MLLLSSLLTFLAIPVDPATLSRIQHVLWGTTPSATTSVTFSVVQEHGQAIRNPEIIDGFGFNAAVSNEPLVVFNNAPKTVRATSETPFVVRTKPMKVRRPKSPAAFEEARWRSMRFSESAQLDWEDVDVLGPDVSDRLTLLELAKMTGNAYATDSGADNWYPLDPRWNNSTPFGWKVDEDGFRGHVFASADNSTVVLSIKGTSIGNEPTSRKDKLNDNRLFSCCCGYLNWSWRLNTACKCFSKGHKCSNSCIRDALLEDSVFYTSGVNLYNNLTYLYPNANIWIVGHSLGGALASLLGATFGAPVVAFESPGERLAAHRLHLPMPPPSSYLNTTTYHVYHTADPIPAGACTGITSLCQTGGYAMETRCHLGNSIIYDTVGKLGWKPGLKTHSIVNVIHGVLRADWEDVEKGGRAVPEPVAEDECTECFKWVFDDETPNPDIPSGTIDPKKNSNLLRTQG